MGLATAIGEPIETHRLNTPATKLCKCRGQRLQPMLAALAFCSEYNCIALNNTAVSIPLSQRSRFVANTTASHSIIRLSQYPCANIRVSARSLAGCVNSRARQIKRRFTRETQRLSKRKSCGPTDPQTHCNAFHPAGVRSRRRRNLTVQLNTAHRLAYRNHGETGIGIGDAIDLASRAANQSHCYHQGPAWSSTSC